MLHTQISTTKHQNAFDDILRQNGYPENSIDQTKRPQSHRRDSQPTNTEWSYLKLPYISERLNYRITNIFRKENILVRIARRSNTLTIPRSVHAPGTSAPFPTPNYVYEETPSTTSRVRTAINITSVALHASFTIASKNTRNIYFISEDAVDRQKLGF